MKDNGYAKAQAAYDAQVPDDNDPCQFCKQYPDCIGCEWFTGEAA